MMAWYDSFMDMDNWRKILGFGTLGAGAIGAGMQMFGKPPQAQVSYQPSPYQQQAFSMGQQPLQQAQGLLQNPQIPPALSQLVEQAFQPQMGNIATGAIESARRRGFAGGAELLNTGPGGAIAGPALSDLQGQMAMAKLNLYNQWIQNLLGAGYAGRSLGQGFQGSQVTQAPRPTLLQTLGQLGPVLQGAGQMLWPEPPKKPTTSMSGQ